MIQPLKKVAVLGDAMIDIYHYCDASRLAPEGPFPVLKELSRQHKLGGSLNVASLVSDFGMDVAPLILTPSPTELLQTFHLESFLERPNVSSELFINTTDDYISCKHRFVSCNKIVSRSDIDSELVPESYRSIIVSSLQRYQPDIIIISDYNKGALSDDLIIDIISFANTNHITVIIDPKSRENPRVYSGADYITPNLPEASYICKFLGYHSYHSHADILKILHEDLNIRYPIVTLGPDGICGLFQGQTIHKMSPTKELYDVTGAGDSVVAVLCRCISQAIPFSDCLSFSTFAGSLTVSHLGNASLSIEQVFGSSTEDSIEAKLLRINRLKAIGNTIAFTNGCFDVMHCGHLEVLSKARSLADVVVVGVNSDSSVRRLKGSNRPFNNLSYRLRFLEALRDVDIVIPFYDDTPLQLIMDIKPDFLVKGGDYSHSDIVGSEYSGQVVICPTIQGLSTTAILSASK